jgi:tetratricopeptide (TPR) repeat protein
MAAQRGRIIIALIVGCVGALLVSVFDPLSAVADEACLKSAELVKKGVDMGDGSDAEISVYHEAIQRCPKMVEAHFNMGLALQKKGDLSAAEAKFREAIRIKDDETFRIGLAGVLMQKGEVSAAREQYERVLEQNPKSVAALQGTAVILEKQQNLSEAVATLQKAGGIDESNYLLGMVQSRLGKLEDARRSLQAAAELRPDDVRVHLGLGEVYEKLGERGLAETALRRVAQISPTNFYAQINLGLLLIENKQYREAIVTLNRAASLDGKNSRVWSALGRAQLELGDMDVAENNLRHAISLEGSNAYAHNNLGVLLQRLGKKDEARQEFKVALALNPSLEVARKNLDVVGED